MLPGGEGVQLEECRARVDEQVDALARGELAARAMALGRPLAAAGGDERGALPQLREQAFHVGCPAPRTRRSRDRPCSSTPSSRQETLASAGTAITIAVNRKDGRKSLHAGAPRVVGTSEGTRRRRQRTARWRSDPGGEERASGGPVCGGPGPPPLGEAEGAVCALQTVSPSREHTPVGLTTDLSTRF